MERSLMRRSSGVQGVQEFQEGKRAGADGNVSACRRVGVSACRRLAFGVWRLAFGVSAYRRVAACSVGSTIFIASAVQNSVSSVGVS
jgi:hypothetical protein